MEGISEEELSVEIIECRNCEAQYSILLGEDFLHENSHYCPFCGDYNVREDKL
jgi:uncharacterized paraquat-inducible protein A